MSDEVFIAAGPGRPGLAGPVGSVRTYRFGSHGAELAQTVSEEIRVGGSLLDESQSLIHVLHEVSANSEFYPKAIRGGGGEVVTYRINPAGRLEPIDRILAFGARPAQLSFAAGRRFLLQANRGAGGDGGGPCTTAEFDSSGHLRPQIHITEHSVVCRRRNEDGTIGDVTDIFTTTPSYRDGFSAVAVDPANGCLIVCTADRAPLRFLRLEPDHGTLVEVPSPAWDELDRAAFESGSVVFHPAGRWLYSAPERASTISLTDCYAGELRPVGSFQATHDGLATTATRTMARANGVRRAALLASADGNYLYVLSSTDEDPDTGSIAVFAITPLNGRLAPVQTLDHPAGTSAGSGADLSPDGRRLAVPCPASHEVLIFDVGPGGRLSLSSRIEQKDAAHARFYRSAHRPSDVPNRKKATHATVP